MVLCSHDFSVVYHSRIDCIGDEVLDHNKLMKRKPVYICHPFREANMSNVEAVCRQILGDRPGILPISPIHAMGFVDESIRPSDREAALECDMDLLRMVAAMGGELWAYGDYTMSNGCKAEIQLARDMGMPVELK